MPLVSSSTYSPTRLLRNKPHLQTVLPSLIRRLYPAFYRRERVELNDGDFLDVDWNTGLIKAKRVVVICHGLEGSSRAPYVKGMVRAIRASGWDVAAMNFRSCSGQLNALAKSYHSGETTDLSLILSRVFEQYDEVSLIGFSLGGNVVLKYLGEQNTTLSKKLIGAVAFSVPCDLASSGESLKTAENAFYMRRFLRMLEVKVRQKHLRGDWIGSPESIKEMRSFWEFDNAFTAPLHGFSGANEYYQKSSSKQFLSKITCPTLLINALNDPFLAPECFPVEEAKASTHFHFEMPSEGGHCGFPTGGLLGIQWHEKRAIEFLKRHTSNG